MFTVSSLFTVLGLLTGRARAVRSGNILLFLGLGFHLTLVRVATLSATTKGNTILQYLLKIFLSCHNLFILSTLQSIQASLFLTFDNSYFVRPDILVLSVLVLVSFYSQQPANTNKINGGTV